MKNHNDLIAAIAALPSPVCRDGWRYRETVALRSKLSDPERVSFHDGVASWGTNPDRPIPTCVLADAGIKTWPAQEAALAAEMDDLRERMAAHVPSAEEMFEMRAAFGEGAEVVNALTGKITKL